MKQTSLFFKKQFSSIKGSKVLHFSITLPLHPSNYQELVYCVDWFSKVLLNKVIGNKQNLIDEGTCWKFQGNVVSGENEGLVERLSLKVESGGCDLRSWEENKFDNGRGKLVTFSCLW